jgi:PEP-CTERM motif
MKIRKSWLLAVSAVALVWASDGRAASVYNQNYRVENTASGALVNNASFSFSPINQIFDQPIGAVSCGTFGCYGAEVRATIGAVLKFEGGANLTTGVSTALTSRGNFRALAGLDATSRSIAAINNNSGASFVKATFGEGDVQANFDAQIFAGAKLTGRACLAGCIRGTLIDYSIGDPAQLRILGYDSTNNSVTFLGNTQTGALPQHYNASGGLPISAELNALNLSGTTANAPAVSYHTQQRLAGAFLDVAAVLADKLGVPRSFLRGSKFGFDYTTLSANVGVALNAVYDATVRVGTATTAYIASNSMELFNSATNTWTAIGKRFTLDNNKFNVLRPVDPNLQKVSVLPFAVQAIDINAKLDLQASIEGHIRILEVHGNGVNAGPLFRADPSGYLGSVGQFSSSTSLQSLTALNPFTLDFAGSSGITPPDAESFGGDFIFLPNFDSVANINRPGRLVLVTNYNTAGCNSDTFVGCILDATFSPVLVERMSGLDEFGNPVFTYSTSFQQFHAINTLAEGAYGQQWSTEQLTASLQDLPPPGSGYQLPDPIATNGTPWNVVPDGTPPLGAVPEPASWAMMIFGFGLVGGAMRSKRRSLGQLRAIA